MSSYAYEIVNEALEDGMHVVTVRLTSQTWQGIVWRHWLTILRPENCAHPDKGMLFISGGNNTTTAPSVDSGDNQAVLMVARALGATAAILNQVPNQPLMTAIAGCSDLLYLSEVYGRGRRRLAAAVSHGEKRRARHGCRAGRYKGKYGAPIEKFLVGRVEAGRTTWLSCVDTRIERIAPIIIDMLNTREQMMHQKRSYGAYSQSIDDYTDRQLQDRMLAGEGDALLAQVDPYSWRQELTLPKLIVLGTNDPYWTVDAANLYFEGLHGRKYLYYQANTPHDVSLEGVATVAQFFREMLDGTPFPELNWDVEGNSRLTVQWEKPGGEALLWEAVSPNRDFREVQWNSRVLEGDGKVEVELEAPEQGWRAAYVEVKWPGSEGCLRPDLADGRDAGRRVSRGINYELRITN